MKWRSATAIVGALLFLNLSDGRLQAETGYNAWLCYSPLAQATERQYQSLPASAVVLGDSPVLSSAQSELIRGVRGMLGRTLRAERVLPKEPAFLLATLPELHTVAHELRPGVELRADGFWITTARVRGQPSLVITGPTERGVLYGVFALLRKIALGEDVAKLDEVQNPSAPFRWVDEWDNLDGTIERGYAGPSIFFENGTVSPDLTRVRDYARLLASLGINGCVINNVNADAKALEGQLSSAAGADCGCLPSLGRAVGAVRKLRQPEADRRIEYIRSPGPNGGVVVAAQS